MTGVARDDDEAWRAIVENYGDRADLEHGETGFDLSIDEPAADPPAGGPSSGDASLVDEPAAPTPRSWDEENVDSDWSSDRFVPPPPPPVPRTSNDRYAAWAGVFGAPAILLVCLVVGIDIPELVAYLLVAAFVGGFVYLVLRMSREPRDPGDDGAVL